MKQITNEVKKLFFVDKNLRRTKETKFPNASAKEIQILFTNIFPGIYLT